MGFAICARRKGIKLIFPPSKQTSGGKDGSEMAKTKVRHIDSLEVV